MSSFVQRSIPSDRNKTYLPRDRGPPRANWQGGVRETSMIRRWVFIFMSSYAVIGSLRARPIEALPVFFVARFVCDRLWIVTIGNVGTSAMWFRQPHSEIGPGTGNWVSDFPVSLPTSLSTSQNKSVWIPFCFVTVLHYYVGINTTLMQNIDIRYEAIKHDVTTYLRDWSGRCML